MCQAYPGMTPAVVVSELTSRFVRARAQHERASRIRAVEIFEDLITWMNENGLQIASAK